VSIGAHYRERIALSEVENIWNRIRSELRATLSDSTFQMWIDPLTPRSIDGEVLTLSAPESISSWIQTRFSSVISEAANVVRGTNTFVKVSTASLNSDTKPSSNTQSRNPSEQGDSGSYLDLNPKLSFDQFVIGKGNRLAHAAALAAAEMPASAYNPLFIYGPPGTGKTHLLNAIGNLALQHSPDLRVRFASAETFTSLFVASIRNGDTSVFKQSFRNADLLLIDDAQFLANKTKTEEEFFHTFNHLVSGGAQVVLTCDRMPADIDSVEQRLRDRFASGLVVDISAPDTPSKIAILAMRARRDGLGDIPLDALETIADRIKGNGRALEGALIRVVAYASLTGESLTRDLASQVLDQLYPERSVLPRAILGTREIKEIVAETYGIRIDEIESQSRAARVVWPRQVAMYLAREVAGEPLPEIGAKFGGRNHSTVLNACQRVKQKLASDPNAAITVRSLERRIVGGDDRND
jgi:chromosomal replication initiator protein